MVVRRNWIADKSPRPEKWFKPEISKNTFRIASSDAEIGARVSGKKKRPSAVREEPLKILQ
jgi:hypothetical protein